MNRRYPLSALALLPLLGGNLALGAQNNLQPVQAFGENPGQLKMYLYAPNQMPDNAPVVVALHGCLQKASDYENAGWNELADALKFYVIYPEQTASNNPSTCFNWAGDYGDPADMTRGEGENQSVVSMVNHVKNRHSVDDSKVFISGFSAGGAFANVLLATWPDVFAAGAINAGIPYYCADNVMPAFRCMLMGKNQSPQRWGDLVREKGWPAGYDGPIPRISLWHGSKDGTVVPSNLQEQVDQWTNVHGVDQRADISETISTSAGNHAYQGYTDEAGVIRVETYSIQGMDHGVALDSGPGNPGGCGNSFASYFYDEKICSTYRQAVFFGLDNQDKTPPDITLQSPSDGETVSGSVEITAQASDNEGVERVEFFINGQRVSTDSSAPYTHLWDSSQSPNGMHQLTVVAVDGANLKAEDGISVIVEGGLEDTQAPTVTLISPESGDVIGQSTTITATATDNFGVVDLRFYLDDIEIGSDNTAPYQLEWDSSAVEEGAYTIRVEAFDAAGLSDADSADITIDRSVSNFSETFSSTGPDNAGWDLGGFSLSTEDHSGGSSASITAEIEPFFTTETEVAEIDVQLGTAPVLTYYRQLDFYLANTTAEAAFIVKVNGVVVDQKIRSNFGSYSESNWTERSQLDLSAFAGQMVTLSFELMASDSASIVTSASAWVDDIQITHP